MKTIRSVEGITDPYTERILSNILGKDAMVILRESPKKIERATSGLTKKQLQTQPEKGKWSIGQIVAHLCDSELALAFRFRMALAESGCVILAYDENKWSERQHHEKADVKQKIAELIALRKSNLHFLRSLAPAEWSNYGMHEERGKETIERMAQLLAGHDVNHVRRIEEIRKILLKDAKR